MKKSRASLPPSKYEQRFGPLPVVNRQEVPTESMRKLRPAEPKDTNKLPGRLQARNLTRRRLFVLIDGFRIGSVAPGQTFVFRHMPPGYYRLAARSPLGIRSWGPRDLYLPGTWTLR